MVINLTSTRTQGKDGHTPVTCYLPCLSIDGNNGTLFRKEDKRRHRCFIRVEDRGVNINRSIRRLTNLFIILFITLTGGLVYWQVVAAQQVTSNTYVTFSRQCMSDNAPVRGRIFDLNRVFLPYSTPTNNPTLSPYHP